eukprot:5893173-Pyramimonas_sp.AAC.1
MLSGSRSASSLAAVRATRQRVCCTFLSMARWLKGAPRLAKSCGRNTSALARRPPRCGLAALCAEQAHIALT